MTGRPNWHLLTFGGGSVAYRGAVERLTREARRTGWFSRIDGVTDRALRDRHPRFVAAHQGLLVPGSRGYGYWIWKPFLVLEALRTVGSDVDGIVYLDSGTALNWTVQADRRMQQYYDVATAGGGLCMQMPQHPERLWTKRALLDLLDVPEEQRLQGQAISTAFLLRSDNQSMALAEEWLRVALLEGYRYLDDSTSHDHEEDPDFREHRHDQSIFSCLTKRAQLPAIPDETYWAPEWERHGHAYPIWALRSRSRTRVTDERFVAGMVRASERLQQGIRSRIRFRR